MTAAVFRALSATTCETVQVLGSKNGRTVVLAFTMASGQSVDRYYINQYTIVEQNERTMKNTTPAVIDPATLRRAAGEAVGALKLLANEERLLLLCQLSQGEMCVSDLEEKLGIRQPTLSQQLGVLRSEGVVTARRDGKRMFYSVADPKALQVLEVLYRLYCPKD